ncbi:P1 family peptidase [Micromonospora sp. DT44]|uniref:P1 family peptidase n=1 Tax=Micromonospora sp. DT44 TaxID=3393439 RepID=UPI003CF1FD85
MTHRNNDDRSVMNQVSRRARDLGIIVGPLPTGRHNAIIDVPGILIGHTTIDDGADLHTGVTGHRSRTEPTRPRTVGPARRRAIRQRQRETRAVTTGALVQSNFGGVLTALGVPLPADELTPDADRTEPPGNSCMIVVATDTPLDARQLGRLARRAVFAMGRVTGVGGHASRAVAHGAVIRRLSAASRLAARA